MRIAICTPFWGRADVASVFWHGVSRLQEQWAPHTTTVYAAGNEPVHRELTREYEGRWIEHENQPLGKKWNTIVQTAYADGADFFVIIGSDDLIMPGLADEYRTLMESGEHHYWGIDGLFLIEPATRRAMTIRVSPRGMKHKQILAGAGRVLRRDVIAALPNQEPYSPFATGGLDFFMTVRLQQAGKLPPSHIFPHDGFIDRSVIDIKSAENIWSLERIEKGGGAYLKAEHVLDEGADDPYEHIVSFLPRREQRATRKLEQTPIGVT